MQIKQHAPEQPMGQRRNQKGNQEISWNKWKWKYNVSKPRDAAKAVLRSLYW